MYSSITVLYASCFAGSFMIFLWLAVVARPVSDCPVAGFHRVSTVAPQYTVNHHVLDCCETWRLPSLELDSLLVDVKFGEGLTGPNTTHPNVVLIATGSSPNTGHSFTSQDLLAKKSTVEIETDQNMDWEIRIPFFC
ncbi:hypothetical protein T03_14638 [Trichinella britovi]|uniref:Uncharacterized protein n=1 Tax=Trichinella britovi TaxID=45882 RepID=A0A0V1C7P2_TRIBR|nr:hypothetical protein T03_6121 [Trichinella britovi]KRY46638.1 hypothetical protein T03_14638 [Trichinella britovi]